MRLDQYLFIHLHIESRNKAQYLIKEGLVLVNGTCIEKSAYRVPQKAKVQILGTIPYVSRGGHKLEAALHAFNISVKGLICCDVGASTGGFTDCLLQHEAQKVYAIDVGHNQLHPTLQENPKVIMMEGQDIRNLHSLQEDIDLLVADISFVSLLHCLNACATLLRPATPAIFLLKPQFEAGNLGLRRDKIQLGPLREKVITHVCEKLPSFGFSLLDRHPSPIGGAKKGNIEELLYLERQ